MSSAAQPPPPPPGESKTKPDLNAVYRPDEDAALHAHISEVCKDPEMPGEQAVKEVLELLNPSSPKPEHRSTSEQKAADPANIPDLLGDAPSSSAQQPDLLLDVQPASVDLLGTSSSSTSAPAPTVNLLGEPEQAPVSAPLFTAASDLLGEVDTKAAYPLGGLLGSTAPAACDSNAPDPLLAGLLDSPAPAACDNSDLLSGGFGSMKVVNLAAAAADAPAAHDTTTSASATRVMSSGEQEMLKVLDMEKMAVTNTTKSTIDLSGPAPTVLSADQEESQLLTRLKEVAGTVLPSTVGADTQGEAKSKMEGFGSADIHGSDAKPRTLTTDAAEAWAKVVDHMPAQVKHYVTADTQGTAAASSSSTAAAEAPSSRSMESDHKTAAVNRACEGRWVPTYMRQQLAAGGHTEIPRGVNHHEYNRDRPPPTFSNTFREMGEEMGDGAQAMFAYMVAFLSTLAIQCQICTQSTASTAHESIIESPFYCCGHVNTQATPEEMDERIFAPLPDEASAGLGPARSRIHRSMQGMTLDKLLEIVKTKLVTRSTVPGANTTLQLPPSLQRLVKAREVERQVVDRAGLVEVMFAVTEANLEGLPPQAVDILGVPGPTGGDLSFREKWRVARSQSTASVDFSNEHLDSSQVIVAIRLDIVDRPDIPGGCCEVESKLYVKPRAHGAVMPIGLVEKMTEMHHSHCESLRDTVMGLAQANLGGSFAGSFQQPQTCTPAQQAFTPSPIPPSVHGTAASTANLNLHSVPEKRPCQMQEHTAQKERTQAVPADRSISLDKSLLLKVADGI